MSLYLAAHFAGAAATLAMLACLWAALWAPTPKRYVYLALALQTAFFAGAALLVVLRVPGALSAWLTPAFGAFFVTVAALALEDVRRWRA